MNWIESLYRTYENFLEHVGKEKEGSDELLLPLSHTTQNAHIEVTLDHEANFISARVLQKSEQKTLVPCTEASGGRSGSKPTCHPLCDKLQYVAGDFVQYGGSVTSGFADDPSEPHRNYIELLTQWQTTCPHPKVKIVLDYVRKSSLIQDLLHHKIIPVQANELGKQIFLDEWKDENTPSPGIFSALPPGGSPQDAFVRWAVNIPGDPQSFLHADRSVWESWNDYYKTTQDFKGLCYVTGEENILALQHPAKLRHAADKAKLISANDSSGFTFRGRFTDPDGQQTCGVSFDVTQKAHNTLRWLLARQGDRNLGIVAWAVTGQDIPSPLVSTPDLLDEEDFLNSNINLADAANRTVSTGQPVAAALKKKLNGYRADLGDASSIVVLALDSATPGRMAISYYRELGSSEFLARIESWHVGASWFQNFSKDKKFIGAPSPFDIAQSAYGSKLDDKLKSATYRRLLPCIIENRPIPTDLVSSCIQRATNRIGLENWEWEKALGIACALYRKQQLETNGHEHTMSLERNRTTRSYLYGRLLAVADYLESSELEFSKEDRESNATRLMLRFADRPYSTWRTIELSLAPYRRRLKTRPPLGTWIVNRCAEELSDIMSKFSSEDFEDDKKLEGEFLLAFHCQRTALFTKKDKETPDSTNESDQD
ncbi:MAG: type I-C CRISPR-associated protein Cas8c/Csd1 [Luteolibacter sp.]